MSGQKFRLSLAHCAAFFVAMAFPLVFGSAHASETAGIAPPAGASYAPSMCLGASRNELLAGSPVPSSKSAAILGGRQSALDAIRAQQQSFASGSLIPSTGGETRRPLVPALARISRAGDCENMANAGLARTTPDAFQSRLHSGEIFGSRRVAISRTYFDAQWQRVSRDNPAPGVAGAIPIDNSTSREERLEAVNRWVNARITYVEDSELFGKADYWAGPSRTLALGQGDCEDYAILKMHLLEAAGIAREDMTLTIARDLVRRADHAVLIVKTEAGLKMLDNATDEVLDGEQPMDYRPVLSFSADRKWVHGY